MDSINVSGFPHVIEISGIGNTTGIGDHFYPILYIQISLSCNPLRQDGRTPHPYTIIEMIGQLHINSMHISQSMIQYLRTEVSDKSVPGYCQFQFPLDIRRIEKIEEIRRGSDIEFGIGIEGLIQDQSSKALTTLWTSGPIKVKISQSHWVKEILSKWNYGQAKLVEIYFPETYKHDILKESYQHIDKAISHFNNGNDSETMASIYKAFEFMAKQLDCSGPDHSFFSKLLENIEDEKREKLKLLLDYFCRYLHLGRHEPSKPPVSIERKDSEFALAMAQVIYAYLSKILPDE